MPEVPPFLKDYKAIYESQKPLIKGKVYHYKAIGKTLDETLALIVPNYHESYRADCEAYIRRLWPTVPEPHNE